MKRLSRDEGDVRLWILYQEDGVAKTGLTDLKVIGKYSDGTTALAEQTLTEVGTTGEYEYDWSVSSVNLDEIITIYFKKGSDVLVSEEYYFSVVEDMDAVAM